MDKKTLKPRIRFANFTDAWEQRKLSCITDRVVRKNTNLESKLPLTISSQYGLVDQITYFNNRVASKNVCNYYLIKRGEFAYNKSYSDGYPYGAIKRLDLYEKGVLSTLYIIFSLKPILNSNYMVSFYNTNIWHREVAEKAAEGARNHGLLNISANDFFSTSIKFPKDIKEQSRVGSFFFSLDNLITLHQRKLDKLSNVKKSLLEKMFPQKNSTTPKIRFKGFTDAWEQRKLGDYGNTYVGLSGKSKEDLGHGNASFVTYMNVYSNPISDPKMVEKIEIDSSQNQVKYGDVFFTTSSETPDEVGMSSVWFGTDDNIYLNSFCFGYRQNILNNPFYTAYLFRSPSVRKKFIFLAQGISRYNISKTKVMEMEVAFPSSQEQARIGAFFKHLDDLITLHQRKLEKLKNVKKALLEKMFV